MRGMARRRGTKAGTNARVHPHQGGAVAVTIRAKTSEVAMAILWSPRPDHLRLYDLCPWVWGADCQDGLMNVICKCR